MSKKKIKENSHSARISDDEIERVLDEKVLTSQVPEFMTCADAANATKLMFSIGDVVRLKSESRMMTVSAVGCIDVGCIWMNGSAIEEADFHHDMLTKKPHPDSFPF